MQEFMKKAVKEAQAGMKKGQTPFGACIVKNNKIISCEHNTVWKDKDPTAHAEINAIREACKKLKTINLKGCTIYSTTEPCPMCFSAIHWARIEKIVYGASIADAKKTGFSEMMISDEKMKNMSGSKIKINGGAMKKECRELLKKFRGKTY